MKLVLNIQDSKAAAFLNFIKSLDYITIQDEDTANITTEALPQELQNLLTLSEKDIQEGKLFAHDDVMRNL